MRKFYSMQEFAYSLGIKSRSPKLFPGVCSRRRTKASGISVSVQSWGRKERKAGCRGNRESL